MVMFRQSNRMIRGTIALRGCCCEGNYECQSSEVYRDFCMDWNPAWNTMYPLWPPFRGQPYPIAFAGGPTYYGKIQTDPWCRRVLVFCQCEKGQDFMMHRGIPIQQSQPDFVLRSANNILCPNEQQGGFDFRPVGRIEQPPVYFGCLDFNGVSALQSDQEAWQCDNVNAQAGQALFDMASTGIGYTCCVSVAHRNWTIRERFIVTPYDQPLSDGSTHYYRFEQAGPGRGLPGGQSRLKLGLASVDWQAHLINNASTFGWPSCDATGIPENLCSIAGA